MLQTRVGYIEKEDECYKHDEEIKIKMNMTEMMMKRIKMMKKTKIVTMIYR